MLAIVAVVSPLWCGPFGTSFGLSCVDEVSESEPAACGFACQQRVLKTLSASGYLHSEDEVV